ncbi:MAG: hypothetical protein IJD08_01720 [Oscillospiraceae bacterium]|nr:hypothetical protein [Oscillospiraceae bacterium]
MKKLLPLVLALVLVLTACSNDIPEEKQGSLVVEDQQEILENPAEQPQKEPAETEEPQKENTLPKGARLLGKLGEEKIFALEAEKETRPQRFFDEDGRQYLEDAEITAYELFDSDGNKIIPHPVEDYDLSEPGEMGNEDEYLLICSYKGDSYVYKQEDGYTLVSHEKSGPTGKYLNGFEITVYFWGADRVTRGMGLLNPDGSVFVEPIFYRIEAPFDDRIRLYYGVHPIDIDMMATEIIDLEGNVICDEYNAIYFYYIEDGSYIGIGYNSSFNEVKCRDENGELYEEGCWLVDKDGNKISTKYKTADVERPTFMGDILSPEEIFVIKTLDGETIEMPIKEIAIKE